MFININYADKIGYFELILYNNHNHTNKRPLTPKSMPPTNNVHAKLFRNLMDNINMIILLGLSVQIIKGLFPPSTYGVPKPKHARLACSRHAMGAHHQHMGRRRGLTGPPPQPP